MLVPIAKYLRFEKRGENVQGSDGNNNEGEVKHAAVCTCALKSVSV
jgi:hypothetical protein